MRLNNSFAARSRPLQTATASSSTSLCNRTPLLCGRSPPYGLTSPLRLDTSLTHALSALLINVTCPINQACFLSQLFFRSSYVVFRVSLFSSSSSSSSYSFFLFVFLPLPMRSRADILSQRGSFFIAYSTNITQFKPSLLFSTFSTFFSLNGIFRTFFPLLSSFLSISVCLSVLVRSLF